MLEIKNLQAGIEDKPILEIDSVNAGEVHAIMGPNGSGSIASVLAGRDGYDVTGGVLLQGDDLLDLAPEERARESVFSPSNTRSKSPA